MHLWTINASYRAAIRNCFQNFLGQHHNANQHQDLRPSIITHDEHDVSTIIQTLLESFIDQLSQNDLVCISNGVLATGKVRDDLIGAREKGEAAMETFIETRLLKGTTMSMFDPIKKLILGTFSSIYKNIKITCKNKEVSLGASRSLFAQICIVMQRREIDLKKVLKVSLEPFPWLLAGQNGELKKTSKVAILHALEKDVEPMDDYPHSHVFIIDGMTLIQMIKPSGMMYAKLADKLLKAVLARNKKAVKTDVIFDVYRENSIKNAERVRRSSSTVAINNIIPTDQVYQWHQFLSLSSNKTLLIQFVVDQWSKNPYFLTVERQVFYATVGDTCFEISRYGKTEVESLQCHQEEADARMFFNFVHGVRVSQRFVIHTPDTDVFTLAVAVIRTTREIDFHKNRL